MQLRISHSTRWKCYSREKQLQLVSIHFVFDVCFGFHSLKWITVHIRDVLTQCIACVTDMHFIIEMNMNSYIQTAQHSFYLQQSRAKQGKPYPHSCVINNWLSHIILYYIDHKRALVHQFPFYCLFSHFFCKCKHLGMNTIVLQMWTVFIIYWTLTRDKCVNTTASVKFKWKLNSQNFFEFDWCQNKNKEEQILITHDSMHCYRDTEAQLLLHFWNFCFFFLA